MIELLEHNKKTYKRLCDVLEENNKCALVQATGTGKSYIAGKYIEEHANTTLILVPTNAIADAWSNLLKENEKEVDIITYQAFAKEPNNFLDYDLVIADEMHHLGSEVWGKKFVETYLQSENHKIIGLTATEIRYLDNSRDIAEEIFENIRIDGCDLPTAINTGVLPTFKYVSALYCDESDFDEWKEKVEKIKDIKTQTELKGRLDVCINNMVSVKQAVNENLTDDYKKIIVFLNNVESKETALEMFKDVFPTANFYDVDYSKQRSANNEQINSFKADENRSVLFAVDMLNEGIHIKGTDCVIMFRKTVSPQVYLQQLGRGLASGTDKMPVIFDFVSNNSNIRLKLRNGGKEIIHEWNKKLDKEKMIIVKVYSKEINDVFSNIEEIIHIGNWSEDEIEFLIKKASEMTAIEISEKLGRSKSAVFQKARQLGLKLKHTNYFFSDEEIEYIKENYRTLGSKKISEALGRSIGSVNNLARSLGLTNKKNIEWNEEEILIVKNEYLEIGAKGIIEKYSFCKTQSQITFMANKLGIKKKENESWSEKEEEYIRENFENKSYEELGRELGRSKNSIAQKMRRMMLTRTPRNFRKVYAYNENGSFQKEYSSISECARQLGLNASSVKAAIRHNYPIDGMYYFHDKNFYIKEKTYSKKKVVKLDTNYNLIKTFNSVKEAAKESGLSTLFGVIGAKRENAIKNKDFIWLYEEDYKKMITEKKAGES